MITLATADALDALGFEIFDPHLDLATLTYTGPATGLQAASTDMDARLAALIAPVKLAIDGSALELGFRYTLNITCALKLRPKHWFMRGLMEYDSASLWPANLELALIDPARPGGVLTGCNSFGWSIGLATCACICHAWAMVVRMWVSQNYPSAAVAFTQMPPP